MVFGVFDRLHPGHCSFLEQAGRCGTELVAVITRDAMVYALKKKTPTHTETIRMQAVQNVSPVREAVLGDEMLGSYSVIRKYKPDIICLGYDQHGLREDLRFRMDQGELAPVEVAIMKPYEAYRFHTSLLKDAK